MAWHPRAHNSCDPPRPTALGTLKSHHSPRAVTCPAKHVTASPLGLWGKKQKSQSLILGSGAGGRSDVLSGCGETPCTPGISLARSSKVSSIKGARGSPRAPDQDSEPLTSSNTPDSSHTPKQHHGPSHPLASLCSAAAAAAGCQPPDDR